MKLELRIKSFITIWALIFLGIGFAFSTTTDQENYAIFFLYLSLIMMLDMGIVDRYYRMKERGK